MMNFPQDNTFGGSNIGRTKARFLKSNVGELPFSRAIAADGSEAIHKNGFLYVEGAEQGGLTIIETMVTDTWVSMGANPYFYARFRLGETLPDLPTLAEKATRFDNVVYSGGGAYMTSFAMYDTNTIRMLPSPNVHPNNVTIRNDSVFSRRINKYRAYAHTHYSGTDFTASTWNENTKYMYHDATTPYGKGDVERQYFEYTPVVAKLVHGKSTDLYRPRFGGLEGFNAHTTDSGGWTFLDSYIGDYIPGHLKERVNPTGDSEGVMSYPPKVSPLAQAHVGITTYTPFLIPGTEQKKGSWLITTAVNEVTHTQSVGICFYPIDGDSATDSTTIFAHRMYSAVPLGGWRINPTTMLVCLAIQTKNRGAFYVNDSATDTDDFLPTTTIVFYMSTDSGGTWVRVGGDFLDNMNTWNLDANSREAFCVWQDNPTNTSGARNYEIGDNYPDGFHSEIVTNIPSFTKIDVLPLTANRVMVVMTQTYAVENITEGDIRGLIKQRTVECGELNIGSNNLDKVTTLYVTPVNTKGAHFNVSPYTGLMTTPTKYGSQWVHNIYDLPIISTDETRGRYSPSDFSRIWLAAKMAFCDSAAGPKGVVVIMNEDPVYHDGDNPVSIYYGTKDAPLSKHSELPIKNTNYCEQSLSAMHDGKFWFVVVAFDEELLGATRNGHYLVQWTPQHGMKILAKLDNRVPERKKLMRDYQYRGAWIYGGYSYVRPRPVMLRGSSVDPRPAPAWVYDENKEAPE